MQRRQSGAGVRLSPGGWGPKRIASVSEGLLEPRQLLLDAVQARAQGLRLDEVLFEDAVEEALVWDAALSNSGDTMLISAAVPPVPPVG